MPEFKELDKLIEKYYPQTFEDSQIHQFKVAFEAYVDWNEKVNLISRKDIENLAERHFLHSLALFKAISFVPGTTVLDAGTGGGFPGIPLAIAFPQVQFHLVDSVGKKIKVVADIVQQCQLKNVQLSVQRVEQLTGNYDFVISRAVADLKKFMPWVRKLVHCRLQNDLKNGLLYLKGEGVEKELRGLKLPRKKYTLIPLSDYFEGAFFSSKSLIHIPFCK